MDIHHVDKRYWGEGETMPPISEHVPPDVDETVRRGYQSQELL